MAYVNRGRSNFESSGWRVRFISPAPQDRWTGKKQLDVKGCSEEREWVPTSALSLDPIRACIPVSSSLVLKGWDALLTRDTQLSSCLLRRPEETS